MGRCDSREHLRYTPFQMDSLINSLPKVLRAAGDSSEVAESAAIAAWKHVAGEGLKAHAIATKLEDRSLVIAVRDPIWQNQLSLMKRQLTFRLNAVLGQNLVNSLELRVEPSLFPPPPPRHEPVDVVENDVPTELWTSASKIQDKELRQKFLQTAISDLRRKAQA